MSAPADGRPVVLVAEDDQLIRELIVIVLEKAGYEVLAACDGQEAVEIAQQRSLDLALLDLMMPRLDGYGVARMLRADPSTHDVPIILLTARAREADVAQGYEAGANDYLTKPFSAGELRARIATLLDQRSNQLRH
jgi:DNA-binding response OmpR family regulator